MQLAVEPITYLYIILVVSELFWIPLALFYKDSDKIIALVFALPWLLIGLSSNLQRCEITMCAGS
jgi:hypothetical protein